MCCFHVSHFLLLWTFFKNVTHFQCLTYQDRFAPFVSKDKRPAKCYLLTCTEEACFCDTVVTENLKDS